MVDISGSYRNFIAVTAQYCFLFLTTNFVNKYVLSVLEFKYPTLFQGWQTLVGFAMLRVLVVTKHVPAMLTDCDRSDCIRWIPGMVLFAVSVYTGSKGLSNLPIPAFLALQNLITVLSQGVQMVITKSLTNLFNYFMLMLTVISSVLIIQSDPFNPQGYIWTGLHILSTGALQIYTKFTHGKINLSAIEKLYCSYIYSVVLFAPSSYLIGDALEAIKFPYLYFSKFWLGCILSGVFGVLLSVQTIRLNETHSMDFQKIHGIAKLCTAFISYFVFNDLLTASFGLWIFINLLVGVTFEDSPSIDMSQVSETSSHANLYPNRHNVLYNDYLKNEDESEEPA